MSVRESAADVLVWSDPFSIELGWLDANGHLNMAYYHVMFDRTVDLAFDLIDFGDRYRNVHSAAAFNVETHVVYRREVRSEDRVKVSFQLLGRDEVRLHAFQTMIRLEDEELLATSESLFAHVDLVGRCASAMPPAIATAADRLIEAHRNVPMSPLAGRRIAPLSRPSP